MDEYHETKKRVDQKKDELKIFQINLKKFLIYEYRDQKENEINELKQNHYQLKTELEENQKNYEKSMKLQFRFVGKASLEKLIKIS